MFPPLFSRSRSLFRGIAPALPSVFPGFSQHHGKKAFLRPFHAPFGASDALLALKNSVCAAKRRFLRQNARFVAFVAFFEGFSAHSIHLAVQARAFCSRAVLVAFSRCSVAAPTRFRTASPLGHGYSFVDAFCAPPPASKSLRYPSFLETHAARTRARTQARVRPMDSRARC